MVESDQINAFIQILIQVKKKLVAETCLSKMKMEPGYIHWLNVSLAAEFNTNYRQPFCRAVFIYLFLRNTILSKYGACPLHEFYPSVVYTHAKLRPLPQQNNRRLLHR